jgi:hypothetical protein
MAQASREVLRQVYHHHFSISSLEGRRAVKLNYSISASVVMMACILAALSGGSSPLAFLFLHPNHPKCRPQHKYFDSFSCTPGYTVRLERQGIPPFPQISFLLASIVKQHFSVLAFSSIRHFVFQALIVEQHFSVLAFSSIRYFVFQALIVEQHFSTLAFLSTRYFVLLALV